MIWDTLYILNGYDVQATHEVLKHTRCTQEKQTHSVTEHPIHTFYNRKVLFQHLSPAGFCFMHYAIFSLSHGNLVVDLISE